MRAERRAAPEWALGALLPAGDRPTHPPAEGSP